MINFSLIFPSRERLSLLENLLKSIERHTASIDKLEAWIAIDWDDKKSVDSINRLTKQFPFARMLVTDRQNNLTVGYYNRLGSISCGKYIQVLNDDCEFTTPEWDKIALEALSACQRKIPDNIFYGRTHDDGNYYYSCFPLLPREAFNALGWFFHPEMTAWGADMHLYSLFKELDRVMDLPYNIKHYCHHNGSRERDDVNRRMASISKYNFGSASGEARRIQNIIIEQAKKVKVLF